LEQAAILELLRALVDKSLVLVVQERGQPRRYRFLETVRQYATQRSRSSGVLPGWGDRHLEWYLKLAEELEPYLWGAARADTLHRLDLEEDNLRAALQWSISRVRAEEGLRLAAALGWYWYVRARLREGRGWLEQVLASSPGTSYLTRARVLSVAGVLSLQQQDAERAAAFLKEGLALVKERGPAAIEGWLLLSLGLVSLQKGSFEEAGQRFEQCRTLFEGIQDEAGAATVLLYEGLLACYQENYALAEVRLEQSLPRLRQLGDAVAMARGLLGLAMVARHAADPERARALCTEAFQLAWERGARLEIAQAVEGLAGAACAQGLPLSAARLFGAAAALRESIGASLPARSGVDYHHDVDFARTQLGQKAFESAWTTGATLRLDQLRQVIELDARTVTSALPAAGTEQDLAGLTPLQAEKVRYEGLTRRERQVAALVAQGMSNKEIAEELVVAVRTVEAHITSMLSKLGFSSRTQLATWAVDRGLAPPPQSLSDRMKQY
jgi:non-specific serine/threonine protein kinase